MNFKKFTHCDVKVFSIEKIGDKLRISADWNNLGKIYSYSVDIKNENYDLRLKSEKEMLCMTVREKIKEKALSKV